MSVSKSKKTTKTDTTSSTAPLQQYQPYIDAGATAGLNLLNKGQPALDQAGKSAMDVYGGLAGSQNVASSFANGTNPTLQGYTNLQGAAANDPSIGLLTKYANGGVNPASGTLSTMAQGSASPGQYDSIGSELSGMTNQQVNGDSSQFYKDTLNGKYLNNNPYIDQMAQQSMDSALKSVNQRYAASGMGEGMSTPYAQAAGSSVADANNTLRYTNYNNELNRMGQIGGQSDSMYNATQDRSLSAASSLGQLQLGAQQAKDASFNNDRSAQLAAAQSLGSQYLTGQQQQIGAAQGLGSQYSADNATSLAATNGMTQAQMQALSQATGLSAAQLAALTTSAQLPYTGLNAYAGDMNSLIGKYTTSTGAGTSTETSKGSIMDYLLQMEQNAAKAAASGGG